MQAIGTFDDAGAKPSEKCKDEGDYCVALMTADGLSIAATQVTAFRSSDSTVTISYTSPKDSPQPVLVYLGRDHADKPYLIAPAKVKDTSMMRRLMLSGDFCQPKIENGVPVCTSKLIGDDGKPSGTPQVTGYVYGADGSGYTPVTVHQLQSRNADIEYVADPTFRPSWFALHNSATGANQTFAYLQATPSITTDAVYLATGLTELCKNSPPTAVTIPSAACDTNPLPTLQPVMPSTNQSITLLSRQGDLLFTRVIGREGEQPETVTVQLNNRRTTIARLVTKPANDQSLLSISMTIMDQETVRRNFGAQIAEHYLAVNLDVANRSIKKLQFNKSAVWFDVDYRESSGKFKGTSKRLLPDLTLDLVPANVYLAPFSTSNECRPFGSKTTINCQVYRYGIEQNERVYPDSYMSVLNSFDYATEKVDRILRYVELFGGVLNTIAGGGYVAQVGNTAFRDSASILTGDFLPGFRAVTQDTPGNDRLRANLVNQTFQETVQLTPNGHASTIVLLPRDGILGLQGYQRIVVIDRILNVHIDPDVLNGVKDPPVPLNHVELTYTKDQVRQSLGEPPGVVTAADGTTVYTYSMGPYQTVAFSADGKVTSWAPRTINEQLAAAPTLDAAKEILKDSTMTSTVLTLLNKNSILVDIPGDTTILQYDGTGKHLGTDYTLLYSKIMALKSQSQAAFETAVGQMQLPTATTTYPPLTSAAATTTQLNYPMPDVKNGVITVTFSGAIGTKESPPKTVPTITTITFGGEKPASVTGTSQ